MSGHKHIETLGEAADKVATWSDRDWNRTVRNAFLSGAQWMREQFTLHGTTDCRTCDDGRATLYATLDGECIGCAKSSGATNDG